MYLVTFHLWLLNGNHRCILDVTSRCRCMSTYSTSNKHTNRLFFFFSLPCDSFPSANIIPGSTAPAHDEPILVLQAAFRVESERQERFEAVDCVFTTRNTSCMPKPAAASQQDMVSRMLNDVNTPPHLHVTFSSLCAAVCGLTFIERKGFASMG